MMKMLSAFVCVLLFSGCFAATRGLSNLTDKAKYPEKILEVKYNQREGIAIKAKVENRGGLNVQEYGYFLVSNEDVDQLIDEEIDSNLKRERRGIWDDIHDVKIYYPSRDSEIINELIYNDFPGFIIEKSDLYYADYFLMHNDIIVHIDFQPRLYHKTKGTAGSIVFGLFVVPAIVFDIVTSPIQVFRMIPGAW